MTGARELQLAAAAVRRRWPEHAKALAELAHVEIPLADADPCPPTCPTCHARHRSQRCPCRICLTPHHGDCPARIDPKRLDPPGPGCVACQIADALPLAMSGADLGDGIRSPRLDLGGGGGGPTPIGRPPPAPHARWWTTPPAAAVADDDLGPGRDTPVEAAAFKPNDRGRIAAYQTHHAEALGYLQDALRGGQGGRAEAIRMATHEARAALAQLHRLLGQQGEEPTGGDPGCIGHRQAGVPFERSAPGCRGLCRWCSDFQTRYGRLPPPELVERYEAGYNLTPSIVAQALRKPKGAKTKVKPEKPKPTPSRTHRRLDRVRRIMERITA